MDCPTSAACGSCGCSAGRQAEVASPTEVPDIRKTVRDKYAAAARAAIEPGSGSCCGPIALTDADQAEASGASLYEDPQAEGAFATAVAASLGCGVPTAVADLHEARRCSTWARAQGPTS